MKEGKIGEDEKTKVERRWRNLTASPAATRYDPSWLLTPLLLRFFFDSSKGVSNPYPPIPCFLVLRQWRGGGRDFQHRHDFDDGWFGGFYSLLCYDPKAARICGSKSIEPQGFGKEPLQKTLDLPAKLGMHYIFSAHSKLLIKISNKELIGTHAEFQHHCSFSIPSSVSSSFPDESFVVIT
ncbi:hypothetical protein Lal_00012800 [Lupinus albus]|nr:hypothetical protein Lal_00012800 [Lupinus albus]